MIPQRKPDLDEDPRPGGAGGGWLWLAAAVALAALLGWLASEYGERFDWAPTGRASAMCCC